MAVGGIIAAFDGVSVIAGTYQSVFVVVDIIGFKSIVFVPVAAEVPDILSDGVFIRVDNGFYNLPGVVVRLGFAVNYLAVF